MPAISTTGPSRARAGWGSPTCCPTSSAWRTREGGEDGWRGTDGPLHVRRGTRLNPLYQAFVEAGRQAGFETTEDYNGSKQEGFGAMEQTIHHGRRWSAANAYLRPALKRQNVSFVNRAWRGACVIENATRHRRRDRSSQTDSSRQGAT